MTRAVVLSAVRTPIGRHGGALSLVRPDDLAAIAIKAAVERAGVDPGEIEDVYFGCANQAGEDNRNVARMGALLAGLPQSVAGVTLNRLCPLREHAVDNAACSEFTQSNADGHTLLEMPAKPFDGASAHDRSGQVRLGSQASLRVFKRLANGFWDLDWKSMFRWVDALRLRPTLTNIGRAVIFLICE